MKGFELADSKITPRLIVAADGREKSGKTHFALSGPGPIAVLNRDMGLEGVVQKFADTKRVWVKNYTFREEEGDKAKSTWEDTKEAYYDSLHSKDLRTIVMDTGTDMWELLRLARFGKLTQVLPHHYGPVNAEFRSMVNAAYDHGKNVIILHKMKKEYVDEKWNGRWERSGFSTIGHLVQVNIRCGRDVIPVEEREDPDELGFWVRVRDCRQNPSAAGELLEDVLCSFPYLATTVFPDSSVEDWE